MLQLRVENKYHICLPWNCYLNLRPVGICTTSNGSASFLAGVPPEPRNRPDSAQLRTCRGRKDHRDELEFCLSLKHRLSASERRIEVRFSRKSISMSNRLHKN